MTTNYDALRAAAEAATPGPWLVFDMDEVDKRKGEPMNEPGQGWYWVWAEHRLPHYGGVFEPEKHHPDCGAAMGEAKIEDGVGGKQEYADATYIAAASPDVVLALLDEVEALRADVSLFRNQADHHIGRANRAEQSFGQASGKIARVERLLADWEDDTLGRHICWPAVPKIRAALDGSNDETAGGRQ